MDGQSVKITNNTISLQCGQFLEKSYFCNRPNLKRTHHQLKELDSQTTNAHWHLSRRLRRKTTDTRGRKRTKNDGGALGFERAQRQHFLFRLLGWVFDVFEQTLTISGCDDAGSGFFIGTVNFKRLMERLAMKIQWTARELSVPLSLQAAVKRNKLDCFGDSSTEDVDVIDKKSRTAKGVKECYTRR